MNDWSLAFILFQSYKIGGTFWMFVHKSSGWGIVAIRWLACMGPFRFSNYTVKFWLMYSHL